MRCYKEIFMYAGDRTELFNAEMGARTGYANGLLMTSTLIYQLPCLVYTFLCLQDILKHKKKKSWDKT